MIIEQVILRNLDFNELKSYKFKLKMILNYGLNIFKS